MTLLKTVSSHLRTSGWKCPRSSLVPTHWACSGEEVSGEPRAWTRGLPPLRDRVTQPPGASYLPCSWPGGTRVLRPPLSGPTLTVSSYPTNTPPLSPPSRGLGHAEATVGWADPPPPPPTFPAAQPSSTHWPGLSPLLTCQSLAAHGAQQVEADAQTHRHASPARDPELPGGQAEPHDHLPGISSNKQRWYLPLDSLFLWDAPSCPAASKLGAMCALHICIPPSQVPWPQWSPRSCGGQSPCSAGLLPPPQLGCRERTHRGSVLVLGVASNPTQGCADFKATLT